MSKTCRLLTLFTLAAATSHLVQAEAQININPSDLPPGSQAHSVTAVIQSLQGICLPPTEVQATVSGNSGFPPGFFAVWSVDELLTSCSDAYVIGWITQITLRTQCSWNVPGDPVFEYTVNFLPGVVPYYNGPAQPPAGWTDFGIPESDTCHPSTSNTNDRAHTFALLSPYPNPFNPSATIPFQLDETQQIRLSIHDLRGAEVRVLVEGRVASGEHTALFEAGELPSGVYLARLEAGSRSVVSKLLLVK